MPQVHAILQRAAPADLWQDGRAALAPGIAPVRLRSDATLKQLVAASGAPPPPSRLPLDAVVPRLAGPAEPRSPLGALGNLMAALFPNH